MASFGVKNRPTTRLPAYFSFGSYISYGSYSSSATFFLHMQDDDDDVSQHEFMANNNNNNSNNTDQKKNVTKGGGGGYQRVEDWDAENHDPQHVLQHLKREKARWANKFEDLSGDGI
jgi:hypothetical protein